MKFEFTSLRHVVSTAEKFCCVSLCAGPNPSLDKLLEQRFLMARYYNRFLPDFLVAAQRAFIAAAIRPRAAEDIPRLFVGPAAGVDLLALAGGLPRRFAESDPPLTPSKACIAA
jgi:hypothetical protein